MARWSKERSLCIGQAPGAYGDSAMILPQDQYNSVDQAIQALEAGAISCAGYCIVFSSRMGSYYILWPVELPPPGVAAPAAVAQQPAVAFVDPYAGYAVAAPQQAYAYAQPSFAVAPTYAQTPFAVAQPSFVPQYGLPAAESMLMMQAPFNFTVDASGTTKTEPVAAAPVAAPVAAAPLAVAPVKPLKKASKKRSKKGCC
jgi:hypothetical protein